jgi:hypothetical protein
MLKVDDWLEPPAIPTEVWEEMKRMQQVANEITGAHMDIIRFMMKPNDPKN